MQPLKLRTRYTIMMNYIKTLPLCDQELFNTISKQLHLGSNDERKLFEAQMFSAFQGLTTVHLEQDVKDTLTSMLEVVREVSSPSGAFATTMSEFSGDIKSLNVTASNMMSRDGVINVAVTHDLESENKKHLVWLGIVCSYLAYLKYPEDNTIKVLFFGLLAYAMYLDSDKIMDFVTKMLSFRAQSDDLLDLIIEGSSVFFFGTNVVSKAKGYQDLLDGLGKVNSSSEGLTKYLSRLVAWVEKLVYYVARMFGCHIRDTTSVHSDKMKSIDIRLSELEELASVNALFNMEQCAVMLQLEREINALVQMMANVKQPRTPADLGLYNLQSRARPLASKARRDGGAGGKRMEPYFMCLCGPAGVGKDVYTEFLTAYLIWTILTPAEREDFKLNPANYKAFVRNTSDAFHSGFRNGTKAMIYADLFQRVSKAGDLTSEALEIIHLISKEMLPALSPIAEEKGTLWLTPTLVCATTNYAGATSAKFEELREKAALLRRMENSYIMFIKPEFAKPNKEGAFHTSLNSTVYTDRLDTDKFNAYKKETGCAHTHPYLFQKYDFSTATPVGGIMEETEFRELIKNSLLNHIRTNSIVQDGFNDILSEIYAQADDDFIPVSPQTYVDDLFAKKLTFLEEVQHFFDKFLLWLYETSKDFLRYGDYVVPFIDGNVTKYSNRALSFIQRLTRLFNYETLLAVKGFSNPDIWYALLDPNNTYILLKYFRLDEITFLIEKCTNQFYKSVKPLLDNIDPIYYALGSSLLSFVVGFGVSFTCITLLKKFCALFGLFQTNFHAQAFVSDDQDAKSMNKVQKNQMYMQLQVIHPSGESHVVSGNYVFFVKGRQCITVWHFLKKYVENYSDCQMFIELYSLSNLDRVVPCKRIDFSEVTYKFLKTSTDLVVLTFPNTLAEFPDMTDRFPPRALASVLEKYKGKVHYRYTKDGVHHTVDTIATPFSDRHYGAGGKIENNMFSTVLINDPKYEVLVKSGIYTSVEFPGACGLTVQVKLPIKDFPHTNQPMISHIHVAGVAMRGMAVSIYKEDLVDLISTVPVITQIERINECVSIYKKHAHTLGIPVVDKPILEEVNHDFHSTGQDLIATRDVYTVKRKTTLRKSALYNNEAIRSILDVKEKLYPASLSSVKPPGEDVYIDVTEKGIRPYGRNVAGDLSDKTYYKLANKQASAMLKKIGPYKIKPPEEHDVIFERIIMGARDDEFPSHNSSALARNKSTGLMFKDIFEVGSRKDVFGDGVMPDPYTPLAMLLREITREFKQKLSAGQPICFLVKACPKDEVRKLSKILNGDTRLFSNCDLSNVILQKDYFPEVLYETKHKRIIDEASVGISPYSTEWNVLYDYITEYGYDVACLDHKGFDTFRTQREFIAFSTFVDRFYMSDDLVRRKARMTLLDSMFNYTTVVSNTTQQKFINLNSGLCSGYLITSLIGCYINLVTTKISLTAISAMEGEKTDNPRIIDNISDEKLSYYFDKATSDNKIIVYGDDGMLGSHNPSLYNLQKIVCSAQTLLGCILTDECEDISDSNGYVDIQHACFIARSFKKIFFEGQEHIVAPLRHSSLYKMLFWDHNTSPYEAVIQKVDSFLMECALHGPDFHHAAVLAIHDDCLELYDHVSEYEDYAQAFLASRNDIYLAYDGDEYVPPSY